MNDPALVIRLLESSNDWAREGLSKTQRVEIIQALLQSTKPKRTRIVKTTAKKKWMKEQKPLYRLQEPELWNNNVKALNSHLDEIWNSMSDEEKKPWEDPEVKTLIQTNTLEISTSILQSSSTTSPPSPPRTPFEKYKLDSDILATLKKIHPTTSYTQSCLILTQQWKNLSPLEKKKWDN